jgi:hypothetical protein
MRQRSPGSVIFNESMRPVNVIVADHRARRTTPSLNPPLINDDWRIDSADDNGVQLHNLATGHTVLLDNDQIYGYMTDPNRSTPTQKYAFLQLRIQIRISPDGLQTEPLAPGEWGDAEVQREKAYLKIQSLMPELIAEMSTDLKRNPLIREFFLVKKAWTMNYAKLYFQYYYEEHEKLEHKLTILENYGFVRDVTSRDTKMYRITEEFADYLLSL